MRSRSHVPAGRAQPRFAARLFRAALISSVAALSASSAAEADQATLSRSSRPNIVLLIADDLGQTDIGCYGNDRVPTQHIDRLAAEGVRFTSAFTPTAICRPSRWVIYTGLYPHSSGMDGFNRSPRHIPLLHDVLGKQGYKTGLIGKFASNVELFKPFDYFVPMSALKGGYDVVKIASSAGEFFKPSGDEPFFLLVGYADPHTPHPAEAYCSPERVRVPSYLPDLPGVRRAVSRYYSAIARLDQGVGLILDELKRSGRADNTIVIFTSDHGPAFPFAKSTLYDAGVAVPLTVRWPGVVKPGAVVDGLVSFVDIMPTILEAAGVKALQNVEGQSFLDCLKEEAEPKRDAVFLTHLNNAVGRYPMRAIRTAKYKYIRNFDPDSEFEVKHTGGPVWKAMLAAAATDGEVAKRVAFHNKRPAEELYLLESDPAELRNRAADPLLAETLRDLRRRLKSWMRKTDDPLLAEWGNAAADPAESGGG